jgi:hypothetical protein
MQRDALHARQHRGSRANLFPERGPDLRSNPGLVNSKRRLVYATLLSACALR